MNLSRKTCLGFGNSPLRGEMAAVQERLLALLTSVFLFSQRRYDAIGLSPLYDGRFGIYERSPHKTGRTFFVVLEAVMHRKLRRRIANAIMVIIIIGVIAAGIWFTGSVMDWWA